VQGWFFEPDNQKDPVPLKSLVERGHCEGFCQMDIGMLSAPLKFLHPGKKQSTVVPSYPASYC